MKTNLNFIILFVLLHTLSFAQNISGIVKDGQSKEPLPFVNVFISKTTRGTQTDEKGHFVLKNLSVGYVKVVASMVGYKSFEKELVLKPNEDILLNINLLVDEKSLAEVKIKGKRDRTWKRHYADFEKIFLGKSKNVKRTKVENPYDVNITFERPVLTADANNTLHIKNDALGYMLDYDLAIYRSDKQVFKFGGNTFFKPQMPQNDQQKQLWENNRVKAYRGSLQHFLKSVAHGTSRKEGFLVYVEKKPAVGINRNRFFSNSVVNDLILTNLDSLVGFDPQLQRAILPNQRYEVHYVNEADNNVFYADVNHQVSWIEIKEGPLVFSYNGIVENPLQVYQLGNMGNRRVADLVPDDYELPQELAADASIAELTIPHFKPQETVFVRTNQDAYAAGDTLWFYANVVDASTHKPTLSEILHLTLRNDSTVFFQGMYRVQNGDCQGFIDLPDSISGAVQLIGFTNYMRNFGEDFFFRKVLTSPPSPLSFQERGSKLLDEQQLPSATAAAPNRRGAGGEVSLHFFPESNNFLVNTGNKVGIRATNADGTYAKITGKIVDETGNELQDVDNEGVGVMYLNPQKDQKLRLQLSDGQSFVLPKPLEKGYILQVDALKDTANVVVKIIHNLAQSLGSTVRLMVHQRGQILFESAVVVKNNLSLVKIPKDEFTDEGLVGLLLLDELNHKIAERFFYNHHWSKANEVIGNLLVAKDTVQCQIFDQDSNTVEGKALLAQVDTRLLATNFRHQNLTNHLLLLADLQYPITDFSVFDTTLVAHKRLDDFILANNVRNYAPQTPLTFDYQTGFVLTGKIKTRPMGEVEGNATMVGYVGTKERLSSFKIVSDKEGNFKTPELAFSDTARILMQVYSNQNVGISIDKPTVFVPTFKPLPKPVFENNVLIDSVLHTKKVEKENALKMIYGRSYKPDTVQRKKKRDIDIRRNYSHVFKRIPLTNMKMMGLSLKEAMNKQIENVLATDTAVIFLNTANVGHELAVFIDGLPTTWPEIKDMVTVQFEVAEIIIGTWQLAGLGEDAKNGAVNFIMRNNSFFQQQNIEGFWRLGTQIYPKVLPDDWQIKKPDDFEDVKFLRKPNHQFLVEGVTMTGKPIFSVLH